LNSSPVWLEGINNIKTVQIGSPMHNLKPNGKSWAVEEFNNLAGWHIVQGGDKEIEGRKEFVRGDFHLDIVNNYEGHDSALKVLLNENQKTHPHQVPYIILRRKGEPIKISGKPKVIGAWVHGNGGWGRISYELRDARGEIWSCARGCSGGQHGDAYTSYTFINFDGWRYIETPFPAYHRGIWTNHGGDGILDYPLTLTGLVFEQRSHLIYAGNLVPIQKRAYHIGSIVVSDELIQRDQRIDKRRAVVSDWIPWK